MGTKETGFRYDVEVIKVDEPLGIVFGFGLVCTEDGQEYFDTHGDSITEQAMVESAADFMHNARIFAEMHRHDSHRDGDVVFAFPLTSDIATAIGVETKKTGLLIGAKPSRKVFEKFRTGEYRGFSIGGRIFDMDVFYD